VANANVIQLYEIETGKELHKLEGPSTGLVGLLFSPDGQTLATRCGDGAIILWETATGKENHQLKVPPQPDVRQLEVAVALRGGQDAPGMAFAPDGKTLAAATNEFKEKAVTSSVNMWNVATGQETGQIKGPEGIGVSAVAFAPDGKILAYAAANAI